MHYCFLVVVVVIQHAYRLKMLMFKSPRNNNKKIKLYTQKRPNKAIAAVVDCCLTYIYVYILVSRISQELFWPRELLFLFCSHSRFSSFLSEILYNILSSSFFNLCSLNRRIHDRGRYHYSVSI